MISRLQQRLPTLLNNMQIPSNTRLEFEDIMTVSKRMKDAVRFGFYSHARSKANGTCDGIAAHCTRLGFGDCTKEHKVECSICPPAFFGPYKLVKLVDQLISAMVSVNPDICLAVESRGEKPGIYDELVSMKEAISILAVRLKKYHAHVLRGRWQQDYIADLIDNIGSDELVVIFDYMMKVTVPDVLS